MILSDQYDLQIYLTSSISSANHTFSFFLTLSVAFLLKQLYNKVYRNVIVKEEFEYLCKNLMIHA